MNFSMMMISKCTLFDFVVLGDFESSWLFFNTLPLRHKDTKFHKDIPCKYNKQSSIYNI